MDKKIVMLCSDCFSTVTLYNYINRYHTIEKIITEEPMRGMALAKRRMKKLGFFRVAGQIMFSVMVVPIIRMFSKARVRQLMTQYKFDEEPIPVEKKNSFRFSK